MPSATAAQYHLKLNFNERDYEFQELPEKAQDLVKDLMRLEEKISELSHELRHLQAARDMYSANLRATMMREGQNPEHHDGNGDGNGLGHDPH